MAPSRRNMAAALLILAASSGSYVLSQPVPDGDPFLVNVWTTNFQDQPRVAANGSGGFVIVWESYYQVSPQSGWDVFARRYDSLAQPLGGEFLVNADTQYSQGWPSVAAFGSGGFIVAWDQSTPYSRTVLARTFDSTGAPLGGEISPPTNAYYSKERPDVAAAPSGASIVTWTWDSGTQKDVFARRIDSNGVPLASEFRVNSYYRSSQGSPAVTMDTDGSFVVAWSGLHTGEQGYGIWAQRFDSEGSALGGEIHVNAYSPGRQDLPDIAMLPDGAFVVVWRDEDRIGGSAYGAWGRRFDSGGDPLGGEFQIHTTPLRHGFDSRPRVSSDAGGNFLVVWSGIVAGNNWLSILGQSFESSGARVGGEFELVHGTPSVAGNLAPDVSKAASGELLAASGGRREAARRFADPRAARPR